MGKAGSRASREESLAAVAFPSRVALLVTQQHAQVAQVVAGRAGDHRISESLEKWESIEVLESHVGAQASGFGPLERGAVGNRARGETVAVDAIGAGAEHGDVFSGNLGGAAERELLVASAYAAVGQFDGDFSAGKQAHAFGLF